jgi:hypothetical protein
MKEEIINNINLLRRKVKSPGRTYSSVQREEMRKEISNLQIELSKIEHQEDLNLINDFLIQNPDFYVFEKEKLVGDLSKLLDSISDEYLKFVLENRVIALKSEVDKLSYHQKSAAQLNEALECLIRGENIPSSNPNSFKKLSDIQKSLATYFRAIPAIFSKLLVMLNEIKLISDFFNQNISLMGFAFLSEAIYIEASNFNEGISIVQKGSKKMYFASNGVAYKMESPKNALPIIQQSRISPDLILFEIEDDYSNKKFGYKNLNDEIVIPAEFDRAYPFVNGFAKISIKKEKDSGSSYGMIDSTGRLVLLCDFFELDDAYNDILIYRKYVSSEGYERSNSFNFDMRYEVKNLGLFSGYLIYDDIKSALIREVDKLKNRITKDKVFIDYYLKFIIYSYTS